MDDTRKLWDSVLVEFELSLSPANFTTWFKNTGILKEEEGMVFVSVPTQFTKEWLVNHYHKNILRLLRTKAERVRGVEYIVTKEPERREEMSLSIVSEDRELPLGEVTVNQENNLNSRYTFENFVVGPFNELAHAAAQAVIKRPGSIYNPFFIYGNTGHGKTHLLYAIGNQIRKEDSSKKILYTTVDKFSNDYVNAVLSGGQNVAAFKDSYRKYDVLIVDDIQFLGKKEKTQEELFHLYDHLVNNQKQIIFSSDKHPNYIPHLEDRLKSRFSAGMTVDIQPPDQETRAAILRSKLAIYKAHLSEDIVQYLSEAVNSNIRELEGALNAILLQVQLKKKEPSLLEVKSLIRETIKPKKIVSIKDVVRLIAEFYNTDESSIYEKTRKKVVVKPRQIIMYILREDFKISYPTIGEKLGGRDHTTVIHSCEKIKEDLKSDINLVQEIEQIRNILKQYVI
ncbi:MAG: chromosomal replication initiator protein DnaA [Patescibacteria group bacterium]